MSVIESVRAFINNCPYLDEFEAIVGVEYLPENEKSYMIEASITDNPIVKRYTNGDVIKRFNFVLASREYFGADIVESMEIAGFYENFSGWMEECDIKGYLPKLGEGKEARHMKVLTNAYVLNKTETKAQYQIQCQLIYFQKRLGGF